MRTPDVLELLGHRRPQLAHRDRHRVDPGVGGEHAVGEALGQRLEQREARSVDDDLLDDGAEGAVVDGVGRGRRSRPAAAEVERATSRSTSSGWARACSSGSTPQMPTSPQARAARSGRSARHRR